MWSDGVLRSLFLINPKFDCCSPGGIPARNQKGERLLLYVGVIDILQSYRLKKRMEHAFKAMVHDGVCMLLLLLLTVSSLI